MIDSDGPKSNIFPVKFRNDNLGKHCMKTSSPCYSIPYTEKLVKLPKEVYYSETKREEGVKI